MKMRADQPTGVKNFSRDAISRAVRRYGLTHWLTLYPPALGIPVGFAGFLFDAPLLYLVMIGSLSLGLASAIVNILIRGDKIAEDYVNKLSREIKERERRLISSLHDDLQACAKIPGAEQYAAQGAAQFSKLTEKYHNVNEVLETKLNRGELTFGRFLGVAEQVYLGGLDNLKQIVGILHSLRSLDPIYIQERLRALERLPELTAADQQERVTLLKREKLRREQLEQVNWLLTRNEEALTKLEETTAAIAVMRTDATFAATDLETAITQLQEMAERVHIYNKG